MFGLSQYSRTRLGSANVTCNINGSLNWDSHQLCIHLEIGAVEAVVTGEVNWYSFIGHPRMFATRSARGTVVQCNNSWISRMHKHLQKRAYKKSSFMKPLLILINVIFALNLLILQVASDVFGIKHLLYFFFHH